MKNKIISIDQLKKIIFVNKKININVYNNVQFFKLK